MPVNWDSVLLHQTLHQLSDSSSSLPLPSVQDVLLVILHLHHNVQFSFFLYFHSSLTQLRHLSPLWIFSLILWFCKPLPFLRKFLQWFSNLGSCLFGPARCPTWPSFGGKAEGQPHNDQCLSAWLIFHVQTGGWLLGPDEGLFKVYKCPPGVVKHGNLSLWSVLCNPHQKPHDKA